MSKIFVSGGGDKVKLYVALLPLGDRTEPQDVDLETSAPAAINTTTIDVDALTGAIAAGTPLNFVDSTDIITVFLAKDAKAGATQLIVEPLIKAIPAGAIAEYVAKQRLLGGTQMSVATNAERTETMVFEDLLGFSDGLVTKQSWNVPWTANLLATSEAYQRLYYANVNAVSGREVYIWQQDPPPAGYSVGDGLKGVAVVTNFTKEMPADGIVTFNCEFTGNGAPTITRYKL